MEYKPKITSLEGELADLLNKTYTGSYRTGYIKVNGCILTKYYKEFSESIENFQVRDDDVWLCGFPKTGTTWTQEMVWSIVNDLDYELGKVPIDARFPLLEHSAQVEKGEKIRLVSEGIEVPEYCVDTVGFLNKMKSPRLIKTHLPYDLLPRQIRNGEKKPKIVYVARNPKDCCISYYHYAKRYRGIAGNFEDFCKLFIGDTIFYGPFWKNVLGFWDKKENENILFLRFEDMKKDLPSVINQTATFLGKRLRNHEISSLNEHLSFASMKANPSVNPEQINSSSVTPDDKITQIENNGVLVRSGNTGQWKTVMSPELIKQFDDWIYKNSKHTGISLYDD